MAAYRADIEIGVKGIQQLQNVTKQIQTLSTGVDAVNKSLKGAVQSLNAYDANLSRAAATLQAERDAIRQYVQALGQANAARDRQNKLIQEQIALQRKAVATSDAGFGVQRPRQASAAATRTGGPGRFSNVVLGAGFPLLFGGGPGAVLGGAAGGLVGGPGALAAQIGLSALGQQLDMFAASATKTGAALSPLTADIDVLTQSLGLTGTTTAAYIAELKNLERQDEALAVATEEMSRLVGDKGVQALRGFGEAATELSNEWAKAMTQMQAALAGLLAGPLRALVSQLESANLYRQAQTSRDPQIQQLIALRNRPGLLGGTGARSVNDITAEIIELQRKANDEAQKREQLESATADTLIQQKRALQAQLDLAYTDGDLTNDKVFKLSQIVIDKEFEVKLQQAINDKTDVELIQLDRKLKLQQLNAKREQAFAAAAEKAARELERQRKEMERMAALRRQQLSDAQRNFVLAEAEIDVLTSNTEESKLQAEYSKLRIERMYTFTDLLTKALSDEEREAVVQTQYLKALADQIKQEKDLLELQKQQTAELYDQLGASGILNKQTQQRLGRAAAGEGPIGMLGFTGGLDLDPNNKVTQKYDEMKQRLDELSDPINMAVEGAQAIGSAFGQAFQGIITGTQTTQQALVNLFKGIADAFISMATQIIAQMTAMLVFKQLLGLFGGSSGSLFSGQGPVTMPAAGVGGGASMFGAGAPSFFAQGGFVTGPTNALIGEGGEPEYVIPASKMRAAMGRYAGGARGAAVIPGNGESGGGYGGGAGGGAIDVRYSIERINNVDYVTAEQFQRGMAEAAQQGAQQGETRALRRLQMSSSTRRKVGV